MLIILIRMIKFVLMGVVQRIVNEFHLKIIQEINFFSENGCQSEFGYCTTQEKIC